MRRRDFLRYGGYGLAALVVGCGGGGGGGGSAPPAGDSDGSGNGEGGDGGQIVDTLNFTITDALKEMITHEPNSPGAGEALCYYWVFKEARFAPDNPGPQIFAIEGDRIAINVTNDLDGPHAFFIEGMIDSGPIQPGATFSGEFQAKDPGVYLYYDNLNAPVNRMMGLHGAFVVMPEEASGVRWTPYKNPSSAVQQLFDDFGSAPWWPGLAWEEGDPATQTDPFRQYVWLAHQASPVLFEEVGLFARQNPGQDYPAVDFVNFFTRDAFRNTSNDPRTLDSEALPKSDQFNRKPHFFTINGQSGFFAHHNPAITPMHRIGEPCVVRILNAGLMAHSLHLHANHFYVTAVDNEPQENPLWVDVYNVPAMTQVDYTIPFMRPPDIPNARGIGRADQGLLVPGSANNRTWPPEIELDRYFPPKGTLAQSYDDPTETVNIGMRQSPLCYPMHDHSEASQTAQGGNYNCGMIAGIYILGDRSTSGQMNFPMDEEFEMMLHHGRRIGETGSPVGGWPEGTTPA